LHGIHLWAQFDSDRCIGSSRPNENDFVFKVIYSGTIISQISAKV